MLFLLSVGLTLIAIVVKHYTGINLEWKVENEHVQTLAPPLAHAEQGGVVTQSKLVSESGKRKSTLQINTDECTSHPVPYRTNDMARHTHRRHQNRKQHANLTLTSEKVNTQREKIGENSLKPSAFPAWDQQPWELAPPSWEEWACTQDKEHTQGGL